MNFRSTFPQELEETSADEEDDCCSGWEAMSVEFGIRNEIRALVDSR